LKKKKQKNFIHSGRGAGGDGATGGEACIDGFARAGTLIPATDTNK
jgi:hypothetical protein